MVLPVALSLVLAVAVIGGALFLPGVLRPPEPPDLSAVRMVDDLPTTHVDDPVDYATQPPAGGPHFDRWLACGAYDRPVRNENAVHGLEHGVVWITYDPSLPDAEVARLAEQLPDEGYLSPYPGLPAPVVVTVWGRQLELGGADDARLPLFLRELGDGGTAPEPLASCRGGTEAYAEAGDSVRI